MMKRPFGCARAAAVAALAFAALVLALAVAGLVSNRNLPAASAVADRLADAEKARLSEAQHLRRSLGAAIWPGWDQADIPAILYNEEFAFLVGYPDPPPGWLELPGGEPRGGPWELVPDDLADGRAYYRQKLDPGVTPQSFTVKVGERWVASLQTHEWFGISLGRRIRSEIPAPLAPFVPYRAITKLFIGGSDGYVTLMLHETFHAFQGSVAPERLISAERATALEAEYERHIAETSPSWREELALLRRCAAVRSRDEALPLARELLAHRQARRRAQELADPLIEYERQREWLEGLGKYVELESWRQAAETAGYRPLPAIERDPGFEGYAGYPRKLSRELGEMERSARSDVRFYYAGMAQASLLDRLAPGWKEGALAGTASLDEMIADAVRGTD
jgi:hypothetical protein